MHINRGVIVVKPRQPYVDWANNCDDLPTKASLDHLRIDCTTYLVPDWYDDEDLEKVLKKHSRFIFENELFSWTTDESIWPKRGYKTFREWFEIEHHSVVIDLGDGMIKVERT